jgi:3-deoxy-manno-octulosonate cytidylyltransferase (CMP-KDO synthetase)
MNQPFSVVLAIPAWLDSSHLPRKLAAEIDGKPMLGHVLERCLQATAAHATVLCTDSQELADQAAGLGVPSLLTSADCTSGSDRIASVADQLLAAVNSAPERTIIINVQGDQPFLDPGLIDAIAASFIARQPTPEVLRPIYRLSAEKLHNPNVVKVLLAADGRGLYFSRSALPHVRDVDPAEWCSHTSFWGHVGIYAYRADMLLSWPWRQGEVGDGVLVVSNRSPWPGRYTANIACKILSSSTRVASSRMPSLLISRSRSTALS